MTQIKWKFIIAVDYADTLSPFKQSQIMLFVYAGNRFSHLKALRQLIQAHDEQHIQYNCIKGASAQGKCLLPEAQELGPSASATFTEGAFVGKAPTTWLLV